jgi:hypothetical protein
MLELGTNWLLDMVAAEERRLKNQGKNKKSPEAEASKAEVKTAPMATPNASS